MSSIIMLIIAFVFSVLLFPILAVMLFRFKPNWFDRIWKHLIWIISYSALSWVFFNALIWIPALCRLTEIRGPEAAFAALFGWSYLWGTSAPVFLTCAVICLIIRIMRKYEKKHLK